jgi:hypothetical protein
VAPTAAQLESPHETTATSLPLSSPLGWDVLGAGLVLALAFLLASFPPRDSEVWAHLAAGRSLTTEGFQAGRSWLFDLACYGLYQLAGGTGLVVVKALLLALLAAFLLNASWRAGPRWLAALVIGLALVALGPYLAVGPTWTSYLLLGFTVWWLERAARPEAARRSLASWWPLLAGFVVWVNVDEWFFLGPLALALYAAGACVQYQRDRARGRPSAWDAVRLRTLGLAVVAGLLVCLLNPHHVLVFRLPASFSPGMASVGLDANLTRSPFAAAVFRTGTGLTPAGLAYYLLVLLGLVSAAVNLTHWRWPHVLLWGAFFALSACWGAAVPFFAVVAGPITALGLQEAVRRDLLAGRPTYSHWRLLGGRLAVLGLLAAAVLAAWPGWLQAFPPAPRSWDLQPDPSLQEAARAIAGWRKGGQLAPTDHGFYFSAAAARHMAWLCPGEKSMPSGRPGLLPAQEEADYLAVRRGLSASTAEDHKEWRAILRQRHIVYVVLYDPEPGREIPPLLNLLVPGREWSLAFLRGRTAIFAWHDPAAGSGAAALPVVDLRRRAFQPSEDERAPAEGPRRDPAPRTWLDAFEKPLPGKSMDRDEALVYLSDFEARKPPYVQKVRRLWENSLAAALTGLLAPAGDPAGASAAAAMCQGLLHESREEDLGRQKKLGRWALVARQLQSSVVHRHDSGPFASLLLAIRASRRALRADPDDALTHLLLGDAYMRVVRNTQERVKLPASTLRDDIRKVQAIVPLKAAVRLRPNLLKAHVLLADLYLEKAYFDLALHHLQQQLRLTSDAGSPAASGRQNSALSLQVLEKREQALSRHVRDRLAQLDTGPLARGALEQAQRAEQLGLPGKALDILLAADASSLGRQGALLELQLLLLAGRAGEVREVLKDIPEKTLADSDFRWLQAQLAAAEGNYALAEAHLRALAIHGINVPELKMKEAPVRTVISLLLAKYVLEQQARQLLPITENTQAAFLGQVESLTATFRQQADLVLVRGLLALEQGDCAQAASLFRQSLAAWDESGFSSASLARHYLRLLQKQ